MTVLLLLLTLAEAGAAAPAPWRRPPPPRPPPPPAPARAESPANVKAVTLSASVVDATQGLLAADLEFRVDAHSGLRLGAGFGPGGPALRYAVGLEGRRYLVGDFHTGLYVGAGVGYGNAHLFLPVQEAVVLGPTAGAKLTLPRVPVTLQAGVGVDLLLGEGYAAVAPALDVGLGFTF